MTISSLINFHLFINLKNIEEGEGIQKDKLVVTE